MRGKPGRAVHDRGRVGRTKAVGWEDGRAGKGTGMVDIAKGGGVSPGVDRGARPVTGVEAGSGKLTDVLELLEGC